MKKKKNRASIIGALLLIAITAVMMVILLHGTDINEIITDIGSVDLKWLSLSAVAAVLSALLLAEGLHIPLKTLSPEKVKFRDSLGYSLIGSFYSAITPSAVGGQPMQLYYMKGNGVEFSHASLALLVSNFAYQAVVIILPAVMFILKSRFIMDNVHGFFWLVVFGVVVSVVLIGVILFMMFSQKFVEKMTRKLVGLLIKLRIIKDGEKMLKKTTEQLASYKAGAASMREHKSLFARVLVIYILQMAVLFSIPYCIYRSFGLSQYGFFDILALQSVLYIAVCFLPVPGAAGATEGAFVSLFNVVFAEGLIVPAMLLSRVVSFYLLLIVSGIVTLAIQIRLARRRMHITNNE